MRKLVCRDEANFSEIVVNLEALVGWDEPAVERKDSYNF